MRRRVKTAGLLLVTYAVIVGVTLVAQRNAFFGAPIYESGDFAANALQIERAKHLAELVGNYSRWNFHHPGPAFFYVYALGELLFHVLLGIAPAPHNAHLLTGMLLQTACFVAGVAAAASVLERRRATFVVLASALALVHFRLAGDLQSTIWPPNVLVMPFFAFLTSSAAMATGRPWWMPVAVLLGSFLVHGHVGQFVFVPAIFTIAYVLLVRTRARRGGGVRDVLGTMAAPHLAAAVVATPFVATLVLDALRGADSNLARIVSASELQWHEAADVATYLLGFLSYGVSYGVVRFEPNLRLGFVVLLIALPILAMLLPGSLRGRLRELREPLWTYWGILVPAAVLATAWATVQRGELFGFNSLFFFGLIFAALLPAATIVGILLPERVVALAVPLLAFVSIGLALVSPPPSIPSDSASAREIHASLPRVLAMTDPSRPIFLDMDQLPVWFPAGALALELERSGRWFEVTEGGPALIFGYERIRQPDRVPEPIRWVLVDPRRTIAYRYRLSEDLAIAMP